MKQITVDLVLLKGYYSCYSQHIFCPQVLFLVQRFPALGDLSGLVTSSKSGLQLNSPQVQLLLGGRGKKEQWNWRPSTLLPVVGTASQQGDKGHSLLTKPSTARHRASTSPKDHN